MRRWLRGCVLVAAFCLSAWELPAADIDPLAQIAQGPIRRQEAGFRALYTIDRDGTNAAYLTAAPRMISSATPDWSHDGRMVAFDAIEKIDDVVNSRLFVCAVEGPFKGLVRNLGYGNTPSWSPDDRKIAFMLNSGNPLGARGGVWVMSSEGTDRRFVGEGFYPRWSPDGKRLCCHAWLPDGTASLFVIDGAGEERALFQPGGWQLHDYGGTWSPDGQRIVFVGSRRGKEHLATIHVSGADDSIRILYSNEESDRKLFGPPAWSPDGRQIIFGMQQTAPGPRQWWNSFLYSIAAEVRSGPVLLEGQRVGTINRGMSWSPDSKRVIFSSER